MTIGCSDATVDAALAALKGETIDGRQFWTDRERSLMRGAIVAAMQADALKADDPPLPDIAFRKRGECPPDGEGWVLLTPDAAIMTFHRYPVRRS